MGFGAKTANPCSVFCLFKVYSGNHLELVHDSENLLSSKQGLFKISGLFGSNCLVHLVYPKAGSLSLSLSRSSLFLSILCKYVCIHMSHCHTQICICTCIHAYMMYAIHVQVLNCPPYCGTLRRSQDGLRWLGRIPERKAVPARRIC